MAHLDAVFIVNVAVLCLLQLSDAALQPDHASQVQQTEAFMTQLADARVLSGALLVSKAGKSVYAKGYGWNSEELGVPMSDTTIFPLGSNTKLFTAVAVYQLQERGLLNITDAVNEYVDPKDFGLSGAWCPLIYGKEALGCQRPTFEQLLQMSSGLLPSDNMACGVPGVDSTWTPAYWFWKYRILELNVSYGGLVADAPPYTLQKGWSAAQTLQWQGMLRQPMFVAPGAEYCYLNANFHLAGYVVEKITNMSLAAYFGKYILQPVGLNSTYYWLGGQGLELTGIRKNVVSLPSYVSTFRTAPGQSVPSLKVINRTPFNPTDLSLFAGAAGAMFGDTRDLLRFYTVLLSNPGLIGLSTRSVEQIRRPLRLVTVQGNEHYYFGQGVVSVEQDGSSVRQMTYIGSLWGFHAQIRMWVNADNPAQSDAIVVFTNVSPAIPPGPQGCAVATPANRSALQLDPKACSSSGDGADMSTVVVQRLASIWNMTAAA